jgi:hypothetical protein
VARGTYTDASGAADLGASLGKVAIAKPAPPAAPPPAAKAPPSSKTTITIAKPKPGRLEITNPDVAGHEVTVAESGQAVGQFFGVITSLDLPAGLYNVSFGPTIWKSIEVKPGETTVLDPGVIEMTVVGASGHKVLDWETGVEVGELSGVIYRRSVLPSTFTVTFGGIEWKNIEVKAGEVKVLNPAVISVDPPETGGNKVYAEDGTLVGTILGVISELPVPPGKYTIEVGGEKVPLDLAEGQTMEINLK